MDQVHGSSVEIEGAGLLIRGAPGSGKSDLALRLIDAGAKLIADDRVDVRMTEGRILLSAPPATAGLLEVRGLGIVRLPAAADVALELIVDLRAPEEIERLPEIHTCRFLGGEIAWIGIAPFQASAPAKLRHALAVARRRLERVE
jgi:serine kinase of HPr protein (carbohydrate metabolism regulator)